MSNNIGFMQGRLVKSEKKDYIQSFPWKGWKKELKIANKNNLKIIEWTIDYYKFEKNPLINKKKINYLRKQLKNNNVKIVSVTSDFYMQMPITKLKSNFLKRKCKQNIIKLIESCGHLKIKNIVIPLVDNSSLKNIKDEKKTIDFFLQFKDLLKKYNVRILFEIDYSPRKIIKLLKSFNDSFGINYDTGNSASLGFKINEEKKYFKRVHNIHIKDRLFKGTTVKLGEGNCDFKTLFNTLKDIKYKKYLILQTAKTFKNRETEEILENIKFIKSFI